jgi:hypothetical protein
MAADLRGQGTRTPTAAVLPPARPMNLWIVAALLGLLTLVRLVVELRTGTRLLLDHPSGAWATIADDLLHGVLYRPVESPLGWGGTRYPPLFPVLEAGLAAGGLGIRGAGAFLELIALVALVLGTWRFLEAVGVRRTLAFPAAVLVLALVPVQTLLGLGKADLLASAFSVWGLVLAARARGKTGDVGAGVLFGLACLTKWTVVFGLFAAVHHAWLSGKREAALRRALCSGATVLLGLALAQLGSQGRFLEQLRACATGGGDLTSFLQAPFNFLLHCDPADLALLLLAVSALAAAPRGIGRTLPVVVLGWTIAGTALVFASPGIAENHLLDVDLAALIAFAVVIDRGALPFRFGATALPLYAVLAVCRTAGDTVEGFQAPSMPELRAELGSSDRGPLLAENPWFALQSGERPVVLDAFMFRILSQRHSELMGHLMADLRARRFRAVVLRRPAGDPHGVDWYSGKHFGPGFLEALRSGYLLAASHPTGPGPYWTHDVWRPRP